MVGIFTVVQYRNFVLIDDLQAECSPPGGRRRKNTVGCFSSPVYSVHTGPAGVAAVDNVRLVEIIEAYLQTVETLRRSRLDPFEEQIGQLLGESFDEGHVLGPAETHRVGCVIDNVLVDIAERLQK